MMENDSRPASRLSSAALLLAALALVGALVLVGIYLQGPPAAVADGAPPDIFAAGHAAKHVQAIARRPHPMGSAEHAAVRDYLLKELTALGLQPEVQETTAATHGWNGNVAATVQNIVARFAGTGGGRPVLLVAHYDSVATGPGASDDGAGVAAVLETVRALKAGPPLKNDIVALFTDGEEAGLLGAEAFVKEHPAAKNVGLVLNLEARGNRGASLMFETSEDNGWLVGEVARASEQPVANSLMQAIYQKLMNNGTDLSVFKRAGLPGLNFAYIEGDAAYHSTLDTPDRIDPRSLQSQGEQTLALARHFGNLDLADTRRPDAVYFNPVGRFLIHYPQSWVLPLSVLVLVVCVALLVWGLRRKQLRVLGVVLGFVGVLLSVVCAAVLTRAVLWLALRGEGIEGPFLLSYDRGLYSIGFAALTFTVAALWYLLLRRWANVASLLAGALLWWTLLMLALSVLLPGGAYLFTWPLLGGLCALAVVIGAGDGRPASWQLLGLIALGVAVPTLLMAPLTHLILAGLSLSLAGAAMALVVLLSWLLIPQLEFISSWRGRAPGWVLPLAALLVGGACLTAALMREPRDRTEPLPDSVFYVLDASANRAVFASVDETPDEFTSQYLGASPARGPLDDYLPLIYGMYLKQEAAALPLAAPNVELVGETRDADSRTVRLRVTSPRQAPALSVYLEPQAVVLEASVNGKPLAATEAQGGGEKWMLSYENPGPSGFELTLKVRGGGSLKVVAVDQSYELAQAPGSTPRPRPDYLIPARFPLTDSTLVTKSYSY
jgi:hypothetical protein